MVSIFIQLFLSAIAVALLILGIIANESQLMLAALIVAVIALIFCLMAWWIDNVRNK